MVHCFCSQLDEYPLPRGQSRTNCIIIRWLNTLLIGDTDENITKVAFPSNVAGPKAQNLIDPSKLDGQSCQTLKKSFTMRLQRCELPNFDHVS